LQPLFHAGNIVLKITGEGTKVYFFIELIHWMRAQRIHRSAQSCFVCNRELRCRFRCE
jgi:hypothetical protein